MAYQNSPKSVHFTVAFPLQKLCSRKGLSERALARNTKLSRETVRSVSSGESGYMKLSSITQIAAALDRKVEVSVVPEYIFPEYSTIAAALKVERDGGESWKIHYFDFVDEFRRSLDPRLILLPPPANFEKKLQALLASIVSELSRESGMTAPSWAEKRYYLEIPWFPSGIESLKASALLESPLSFRSNNIFVHDNFLKRA